MLGRVLLNGSNKKWIFKKGKWFLIPKINNFIINPSGFLAANGNATLNVVGMLFVKYKVTSAKFSNGGVGNYDINYYSTAYTGETVLSKQTYGDITISSMKNEGSGNIEISEIWLEKIGGGGQ
ncbi:MAG: hypothetical protein ACK5L6_07590 [Anaerorhabdus sp.]|uniref:hypothetical protein n=1 Tax=Anaerorhabdus sp. TaxID=1872524 RepID=UPI003A8BE141